VEGAGEEAVLGGVPELTRINAITTATAATALPAIAQKSVRPRCIAPPRRSCLSSGNVASSPSGGTGRPWQPSGRSGLSRAIGWPSSPAISLRSGRRPP